MLDLFMKIFVQGLRQTALESVTTSPLPCKSMLYHKFRASGRSCSESAITASLPAKSVLVICIIVIKERTS